MNNWTVIKKNNKTYLVHTCEEQKYKNNTSFKIDNSWYCLCCYEKAPSNMNLCADLCYCNPVAKLTREYTDIFLKQFIALVEIDCTQGHHIIFPPLYDYESSFYCLDLLDYYNARKGILKDIIKEEKDYIKKTFQLK